jgi:hypothetical protein
LCSAARRSGNPGTEPPSSAATPPASMKMTWSSKRPTSIL